MILYELLTGELPFRGETRMLIVQILRDDPVSPRKLNGRIPRDLETICLKCLEKEPGKRYESAKQLGDDLRRFLAGEAIHARPVSRVNRGWRWCRRNPVVTGLMTAFIVAVIAGLAGVTWQWIRAEGEAHRATQIAAKEEEARQDAIEARDLAREEAEQRRRLLYISDMNSAQQAWEDANVGRVKELLKRHVAMDGKEDLRGFEWYYLWRLCYRSREQLVIESGLAVDLAFSPNGEVLAIGQWREDSVLSLWDVIKQEWLVEMGAEDKWHKLRSGRCVEFTPDGKKVLYPMADFSGVMLRCLDESEQIQEFVGHTDQVTDAAISRDGHLIATASNDGTVMVWELGSLRHPMTLTGHTEPVGAVAFSPDGTLIASGSRDNTLRIWNWRAKEEPRRFDGHEMHINSVAFSPDGHLLVSGSEDGTARVWSLETGEEVTRLENHREAVREVAFSPDGTILATGSRDCTVKLWDLNTYKELETLKGHSGIISSLAFSPDGKTLASGSQDYTVRLWDMATPQQRNTLLDDRPAEYLNFLPGQDALMWLSEGVVQGWDINADHEVVVPITRDIPFDAMAVSSDCRLATVDGNGSLKLWVLPDCVETTTLADDVPVDGWRDQLAFSPDGTTLALGCRGQTVKLWNTRTGTLLHTLSGDAQMVTCVAFSPDGHTIASGGGGGAVRLWDVKSGTCLDMLHGHKDSVYCVTFSPDGTTLASGSFDNTIKLWNLRANADDAETLRGHTATVHSLRFSRDGSTLFSAGGDGAVKVWDVHTFQERFTLLGHPRAIAYLALSEQENMMATCGYTRILRLWCTATKKEVEATEWQCLDE